MEKEQLDKFENKDKSYIHFWSMNCIEEGEGGSSVVRSVIRDLKQIRHLTKTYLLNTYRVRIDEASVINNYKTEYFRKKYCTVSTKGEVDYLGYNREVWRKL